jgi:Ca2+-binding RTX toxin-like protein
VDQNGPTGGATWSTLMVFQNTSASAFGIDNFTPAYNPDGSGTGRTINGTESADTLIGTVSNDTINGLGGNDIVNAGYGNDQVDGGEGDDTLNGQDGNDVLVGGGGKDTLSDAQGVNSFYGGDGDDNIVLSSATLSQAVIDGGAGNDTFTLTGRAANQTITTGSGTDTIKLSSPASGTGIIAVTDFTTGAGGDKIDLTGLTGASTGLGSANPFAAGYLQLVQNGANVELQWDQNGATGGATWSTVMVFQNTSTADFTTANFSPAYTNLGSSGGAGLVAGQAAAAQLVGIAQPASLDGSDIAFM